MIKDQYTEIKDWLKSNTYLEKEMKQIIFSDKNSHKIAKSGQPEKCAGLK